MTEDNQSSRHSDQPTAVQPSDATQQTGAHQHPGTAQQPAAQQPGATQRSSGQAAPQQVAAAPPPPRKGPGGFGRFVRHRATGLVAAGLVGMLLGGGVVGLVAAFDHHDGPRDGRPGVARQFGDGLRGHAHPPDGYFPRQDRRPGGATGESG